MGTVIAPASTITIIVNGGGKSVRSETARAELRAVLNSKLQNAEVRFTQHHDDVGRFAREAVQRGDEMVVAVGGDGTVNAVACAVAGTPVVFGVIPLGTLNHFARDLGIPTELDGAIDTIINHRVIDIDTGEVNGHGFVNNAGLGMYPDIVAQRELRQRRGARKWPSAFIAAARALARYHLLSLRIQIDGTTRVRRTPILFIGNNEYDISAPIVPQRCSMQDGKLALYLPHPETRAGLVWFALRALAHAVKPGAHFDLIVTESFVVNSKRPSLRVAVDGEVIRLEPPLEFRTRPRSLRVAVPHEGAKA